MVDFTKIIYGILDDHERLAILVHTSATLDNCTIADPKLPKLATVLKSIETELDTAINAERKSPLTVDINAAHDERVKCITSIRQGLLYFLEHDDSGLMRAATLIQKSFDKYLKRLPNRKKSTYTWAIKSFLKELETPEATAALESMLMFEKIDQLASAQRLFTGHTRARAESDEQSELPHIRDIREEMHKMMDVLEHHVYFEQYTGESGYDELVHQLNGRIGEIMAIAKSRHTLEIHHEEENLTEEEENLTEETPDNSEE